MYSANTIFAVASYKNRFAMKTKTNKQQAGSVNNTKLLQQRITHGKQQHTS